MKKLGTLFVIAGILFVLTLDSGCSKQEPTQAQIKAKAEAFEAYASIQEDDIVKTNRGDIWIVYANAPAEETLSLKLWSGSPTTISHKSYDLLFFEQVQIFRVGTPEWIGQARRML